VTVVTRRFDSLTVVTAIGMFQPQNLGHVFRVRVGFSENLARKSQLTNGRGASYVYTLNWAFSTVKNMGGLP
jgi:hypothetical protein